MDVIITFLPCLIFPIMLFVAMPLTISAMNFFLNGKEWDEVDYLEDGTVRRAVWKRKE